MYIVQDAVARLQFTGVGGGIFAPRKIPVHATVNLTISERRLFSLSFSYFQSFTVLKRFY